MILTKNAKIVFAGDSVTDDGRKYPVGEGDGLGNGYVSLIDTFLAVCKKVASARNIPVIDLQSEFENLLKYRYPAYITWDRVHPGRIGSMIIARAFLNKIGYKSEYGVKV